MTWIATFLGQIRQDLRYGARVAASQPGTTFIIVLSLALGIGANTVVFSLVNGILLRSLPYPEPDRLVQLWFTPPNRPDDFSVANATICLDLPKMESVFSAVGCYIDVAESVADPSAGATGSPEWLDGEMLTTHVVRAAGVQPALGRWFTQEEDSADGHRVMLISHDLWQRRFSGAPDILGRQLRVSDFGGNVDPSAIIGVMPRGFSVAGGTPDYFIPLQAGERGRRSPARNRFVIARLKDGVTVEQAQENANQLARVFSEGSPQNKDWGIRVQPLTESRVGGLRSAFQILQGTAALVLLIACANVGGLLLAQGIGRQRELAVRAAVGSGRGRIVRQLLTESVALAAVGAVACLAAVWYGMDALLTWLPPGLPRLNEVGLDSGVLMFTTGVALATAVVFGVLPALQASRLDLTTAFKAAERGATAAPGKLRLRSAFVVVQISAALVLLTGAGLLINSLMRLTTVDPGLDPRDLTTFRMSFTGRGFFQATGNVTPIGSLEFELSPRIGTTTNQIRDRIRALPGVDGVTTMRQTTPLGGAGTRPFEIAGRPVAPGTEGPAALWYAVGADYFEVLRLPVVRGREFSDADTLSSTPVALVNETLARRYWPDEDPIGRTVTVQFYNDQPRQIVGIVPDIRPDIRNRTPRPQLYVPHMQLPTIQAGITAFGLENLTFVMRSRARTDDWLPAARAAAESLDPAHAVTGVQRVADFTTQRTQGFRQYVMLLGVFSGIALLLAVVGIYGVMSHSVTQRRGEIGIRVAFGATARDVLRSVLGRGLAVIGAGIAVGLVASLALTRIISSSLYNVTATDPATYFIVVTTLAVVAGLACLVPARRALKVDPLTAMRQD
jgi:putative ABC transport system permease protein